MRYLHAMLGVLLHSMLILLAYTPLFVRCMEAGLRDSYPVFILVWLLVLNELLVGVTPPPVMVLPVCSFTFSLIIGLVITQNYPWIYPFLLLGLFIFVLGILIQFLISLA